MTQLALLSLLAAGTADGGRALGPELLERPIEITADVFEVFSKERQAAWSGRVKARRDDTLLGCDRLTADYAERQQITRLECLGNVDVLTGTRFTGEAPSWTTALAC